MDEVYVFIAVCLIWSLLACIGIAYGNRVLAKLDRQLEVVSAKNRKDLKRLQELERELQGTFEPFSSLREGKEIAHYKPYEFKATADNISAGFASLCSDYQKLSSGSSENSNQTPSKSEVGVNTSPCLPTDNSIFVEVVTDEEEKVIREQKLKCLPPRSLDKRRVEDSIRKRRRRLSISGRVETRENSPGQTEGTDNKNFH